MNKIALPCSCGCSVVVMIDLEQFGDEPRAFYAEFYTMAKPTTRQRFKTAWQILRGKENWIHDVNLDCKDIEKLRNFLNEKLPQN